MAEPIKVGLIGIGGMGRTHFTCYQNNPNAQIVAICDVDEKKLAGDWSGTALNIDTGDAGVQGSRDCGSSSVLCRRKRHDFRL